MKLHGVPLSVHTRKVQLALRAKGLDHELNVVIPILPETLPTNWSQLSPTGLIPVIEDGDFILPDSSAILQYLDAKHPAIPVIPADPRERGRALWIEAYLGAFFRDVIHPLFHQRVVAPMQGGAPDTGLSDRVLSEVAPRYFGYLGGEARSGWLVGEALSIADIAVGTNLVLFHYLGETVSPARYPALSAYFRRLVTTPIFVEQLAAEKPFAEQMGFSQDSLAA
ncbi:glutathione S-transferase family protein [Mesorhizobium sp. AaZ16]|uniref:glutathione S-transferase family protein n=1 Tax=Mesorhizobium sp. AaZ16 TaxID=3402289 RepID=UPI00374F2731